MTTKGTTRDRQTHLYCTRYVFSILFYTVILDLVLYGAIIPVVGNYLSGACAERFGLTPKYELLLAVLFSFMMVYYAFTIFWESSFWKNLFAFDPLYFNVLMIRDTVNCVIAVVSIVSILSTVQVMVNDDRAMKPMLMSEGTGYVFVKTLTGWLNIDHIILPQLGLKLPHTGGIIDPDLGENGRFENAAAYMLYWTVLSSCVAKTLYFNTLYTFFHSMELFISLNPKFDNEYEDSHAEASSLSDIHDATLSGKLTIYDEHGQPSNTKV